MIFGERRGLSLFIFTLQNEGGQYTCGILVVPRARCMERLGTNWCNRHLRTLYIQRNFSLLILFTKQTIPTCPMNQGKNRLHRLIRMKIQYRYVLKGVAPLPHKQ
jgi:hypothetical protein